LPFERQISESFEGTNKENHDMGAHKSTKNLRKKIKRRLKNERTKARAQEHRGNLRRHA
jgi:hypothetical protein